MQGFEYTTEKAMHRLCIREPRLILRVSNTFKVEETLPNRCKVCPCQIGILRPNKKKQKKNSLLWGFCRPNTSHVRTWLPCRRKKGEIREGQQHRGHVHRSHVASVHVSRLGTYVRPVTRLGTLPGLPQAGRLGLSPLSTQQKFFTLSIPYKKRRGTFTV